MGYPAADVEAIARALARWHASAIAVAGGGTVARRAGLGPWAHSKEKYSDACWTEYRGAAAFVLEREIKRGNDSQLAPQRVSDITFNLMPFSMWYHFQFGE